MTSALVRYSAIVSALLVLLGTGIWLAHGAPDIGTLAPAWHTFAMDFLADMQRDAHWSSRAALLLISPSLLLGSGLSLFLLLRGSDTAYIRHLGVGLGWWCLGFFYMTLLPAIPGVMAWPLPMLALSAADAVMVAMILAASYAFMQFWASYPRPVTAEEVSTFVIDKLRRDYAAMHPWRQRWAKFLTPKSQPGWIDYRAWQVGVLQHRVLARALHPGLVVASMALAAAGAAGLLWRAGSYLHDHDVAQTLSFVPFMLLAFIFVSPWANLARIFGVHRTMGTEEERRKIEWVWASFWIGVVLFFASAVLSNMAMLYGAFFDGYGVSPESMLSILMLQFLVVLIGPLLFLLALVASIFYRGDVDPKLALRGVTLWAVLGVLLTLVFALVERSVAVRLSAMLGLPPQTGLVAAGAIVAATFQPIRKVSEKQVNRFVERVLPASVLASGTRHTGAVAVVDISGYTALSAEDEQAAVLASALVQKEAKRLADAHGGRVVKSTGDGVLMCFAAAQKAADAVKGLHQAVAKAAAPVGMPDLKLHSGLHWGEFLELHDGDIYGQTVNLAARIADWAQGGEIGASETFCMQLAGRGGFVDEGPQRFKNVPEPVSCLKLAGA